MALVFVNKTINQKYNAGLDTVQDFLNMSAYIENTVFPHIVAAATILFWELECGNYSREETIQRRKLLISFFFCQ